MRNREKAYYISPKMSNTYLHIIFNRYEQFPKILPKNLTHEYIVSIREMRVKIFCLWGNFNSDRKCFKVRNL